MAKKENNKKDRKMNNHQKPASRLRAFYTKVKHPSQFSKPQLAIFALAFALVGYLVYITLAASTPIATLQAEQMHLPAGGFVYYDTTASGGKAIGLSANGSATGSVSLPSSATSMKVVAKGNYCFAYPNMSISIDGAQVYSGYVKASTWSSYTVNFPVAYKSGTHSLAISLTDFFSKTGVCDRSLYLDVTYFYGSTVSTGAPTVALSASPSSVTAGQASTLTWASSNATSCTASGGWSGTKSTSGSVSTGALNQSSSYSLTCTGSGGSATASTRVTVASGSIYWGAYLDGNDTYAYYYGNPAPNGQNWMDAPWGNTGNTWDRYEQNTGKKVTIDHYGQPNMWTQTSFATSPANIITNRGAIPLLDMDSTTTSLSDIANGVYDSPIKTWAANVKAWGKPFFLRWDWEMNGTWFNWGAQAKTSPSTFVKAWQRVHDDVVGAGATNVTWVWCPNIEPGDGVSLSSLYPGDSYVDWTCLDGYNKGSTSVSFNSLYSQSYKDLLSLAPTKPIMIGEIASLEYGSGVKANWITDMLSTQLPANYPKIRAFVWFNWRNTDNGGTTWNSFPIESSSTSQAAFKAGIASSHYKPGSTTYVNLPLLTKVPLP